MVTTAPFLCFDLADYITYNYLNISGLNSKKIVIYQSNHIACLASVENESFVPILLITKKVIRFLFTVTKEKVIKTLHIYTK